MHRIACSLTHLGPTLGVLLVQLPPALPYDHPRLAYFLQQLPSWLRVALEFRHPSWHREEVFTLLADHGALLCDERGRPAVPAAGHRPFAYVRLHGPDPHHLYAGSYSEDDLRWWARAYANGRARGETSAYFNNDGEGNAVRNAETLRRLLGE